MANIEFQQVLPLPFEPVSILDLEDHIWRKQLALGEAIESKKPKIIQKISREIDELEKKIQEKKLQEQVSEVLS